MYPLLFRAVLSRFDPEFAHHAGMAVIRVLGVPPLSWATRAMTRPDPSLRVEALGLTFPSPFGIAAGQIDIGNARTELLEGIAAAKPCCT
jgi:dihydroorotate dehydrogenase